MLELGLLGLWSMGPVSGFYFCTVQLLEVGWVTLVSAPGVGPYDTVPSKINDVWWKDHEVGGRDQE